MIQKTCHKCNSVFLTRSPAQKYCSIECRTRECPACGKHFVLAGQEKKFCSNGCSTKGENNPNFGKRRPGMFQHSVEFRSRLSESRKRDKNPNWKGGASGVGKCGSQSYARIWALKNIGNKCEICGSSDNLEVHHVLARKYFASPNLANFPENLMVLCKSHHRQTDGNGWVQKKRPLRETPFLDRLPESILLELELDGLVSSLPEGLHLIG